MSVSYRDIIRHRANGLSLRNVTAHAPAHRRRRKRPSILPMRMALAHMTDEPSSRK